MKKIIVLAVLLGAFFYWKNGRGTSEESALPSLFESETVVIEFTDGQDLLNQLRQVEAGRQVEYRQKPQEAIRTDSGVACDDEAGVAAFVERTNRELEQRNREDEQLNVEINRELKRIQQIE